jgi:ribosome-binding protein aMBF1 (putative translation factor)
MGGIRLDPHASRGIRAIVRDRPLTSDIGTDIVSTSQPFSTGAGHVILVAREVSGLSQRTLAIHMSTSQPTVAKLRSVRACPR